MWNDLYRRILSTGRKFQLDILPLLGRKDTSFVTRMYLLWGYGFLNFKMWIVWSIQTGEKNPVNSAFFTSETKYTWKMRHNRVTVPSSKHQNTEINYWTEGWVRNKEQVQCFHQWQVYTSRSMPAVTHSLSQTCFLVTSHQSRSVSSVGKLQFPDFSFIIVYFYIFTCYLNLQIVISLVFICCIFTHISLTMSRIRKSFTFK